MHTDTQPNPERSRKRGLQKRHLWQIGIGIVIGGGLIAAFVLGVDYLTGRITDDLDRTLLEAPRGSDSAHKPQ